MKALLLFFLLGARCPDPRRNEAKSCTNSRQVLRAQSGIITDGAANYTEDTTCEWLIEANSSLPFINLQMTALQTECSYDYVFVFDGPDADSRLLGSFSGQTVPTGLYAGSGFMYIRLFSDTNYVLKGFSAHYTLTECPNNCSGFGNCKQGACNCYQRYGGTDCSLPLCPDNCGESADRGLCEVEQGAAKCVCNQGFVGDDCSLDDQNYVGNTWSLVSRSGEFRLSPRTRHAAVYQPELDVLYVYGGFDLNQVLGDFVVYSFKQNSWRTINDQKNRINRWGVHKTDLSQLDPTFPSFTTNTFHLSDPVDLDSLPTFSSRKYRREEPNPVNIDDSARNRRAPVMREGLETFSAESSFPETDRSRISQTPKRGFISPPALQGHTMVAVEGGLLMFGGKLANGSLSNQLWKFNQSENVWMEEGKESILSPTPVWQHCMVNTGPLIYVFGGSTDGGRIVSDILRISSTELKEWERVEVMSGKASDLKMTGHSCSYYPRSSSIAVYGGLKPDIPRFNQLSDSLYLFNVNHRVWSKIHFPRDERNKDWIPPAMAFHSSTLISNYLIIFGGYTHKHNSDEECYSPGLYLYSLECHTWISHQAMEHRPPGAEYPNSYGMFGSQLTKRNSSQVIVVGGYHGVLSGDVLSFTLPSTLSVPDTPCHMYGLYNACAANPKCGWCGSSGQCLRNLEPFSCTGNLLTHYKPTGCPGVCPTLTSCYSCTTQGSGDCSWCVRSGRCYSRNGLYQCKPPANQRSGNSPPKELENPEQCTKFDIRPGLSLSRYDFPVDPARPDHVKIVNSSEVFFTPQAIRGAREHMLAGHGETLYALEGTIHPQRNPNVKLEPLKLCSGQAKVSLWMYSNPGMDDYQSILNMSHPLGVGNSYTRFCQPVYWPNTPRQNIFLYQNFAYPVRLHGWRNVTNPRNSLVRLEEGGFQYRVDSLQPFMAESCRARSNCMSCVVDSDCTWCHQSSTCQFRHNSTCTSLPILEGAGCESCADYVHCTECTSGGNCDWIQDETRCVRKGRFSDVLSSPDECPPSCQSHGDCGSCLSSESCVWCRDTQECFEFSAYTSDFQYGGCKSWVDSSGGLSGEKCRECTSFNNCSTCLESVGCGWCYNSENPTQGACTSGSFVSPAHQSCAELNLNRTTVNGSLSAWAILNRTTVNGSLSAWAYAGCPDINECALGIHKCHSKASCSNYDGGYNCTCMKGYKGNGFTECRRSCLETCLHGVCSDAPDYRCLCERGWTGPDCSLDCGCNLHSTCRRGSGRCDGCQDFTTGEQCELCSVGTQGNASSPLGCSPCFCNGHEDSKKGICDAVTGKCHCLPKFTGDRCDVCAPGFFGEAKFGGDCHYDCAARLVIADQTKGVIGILNNTGSVGRDCLWMISSLPNFTLLSALDQTPSKIPPVNIKISKSRVEIGCLDNYLYVYDGIPPTISNQRTSTSRLLGIFCTDNLDGDQLLTAESGVLSVLYSKLPADGGFNASFSIPPQPCHCSDNQDCDDCEVESSTNCTQSCNQGSCDDETGRCVCLPGVWGEFCQERVPGSAIVSDRLSSPENREILTRLGHSLTSDSNGILWMFGGFSPDRGILQDLRAFDTKTSRFKIINLESSLSDSGDPQAPPPRYFHAACFVPELNSLFVHGGMNFRSQLGDTWRFDLDQLSWIKLNPTFKKRFAEVNNLPNLDQKIALSLAGHSLTYLPHTGSIILIGGYSDNTGLNAEQYFYNLTSGHWSTQKTKGYPPPGMYGHSAIYNEGAACIFVFGGLTVGTTEVIVQEKVYAYHVPTSTWSTLPFNPTQQKDSIARWFKSGLVFHAALPYHNYIVFLGESGENEQNNIIVYSVDCSHWISHNQDMKMDKRHWIGPKFDSKIGASSVYHGSTGAIYSIGGVKGTFADYIEKIIIPQDVCNLFESLENCLDQPGCGYCKSGNETSCFSLSSANSDRCQEPLVGTKCDRNRTAQVKIACQTFSSCGECLAQWPVIGGSPVQTQCQWCHGCDRGGKCVSVTSDCAQENRCYSRQTPIESGGFCPELNCSSSSCYSCSNNQKCFWSKLIKRWSKERLQIGEEGGVWSCHSAAILRKVKQTQLIEESSPHRPCPALCSAHSSCRACLSGEGGAEGGAPGCLWSTNQERCFSPVAKMLYCVGGACGKVLASGDECPRTCSELRTCSGCLENTHCGWCSIDSDPVQGVGICAQGVLEGPRAASCQHLVEEDKGLSESVSALSRLSQFSWHFASCPPENECINGHNDCKEKSEICTDTPHGYRCDCSSGYSPSASGCLPVCLEPCMNGTCVAPDTCKCHFGFVGDQCEEECHCFGNSDCQGPDALDICLKCENNTTGDNCEFCQPGFVGDPMKREPCLSCQHYCSGHSDVCYSAGLMELLNQSKDGMSYDGEESDQFQRLSEVGSVGGAVCQNCANNTKGERCQHCIQGYFRWTDSPWDGCEPCFCNNHGDMCDSTTGGDCKCDNHTVSEPNICSKKGGGRSECWRYQCGKCEEFYVGDPANGHQCFKSMSRDQHYCLEGDESSNDHQQPLRPGDTVLYAVKPNFLNVDIKITIDVTQGALDVYLSVESQVFLVNYNHSTGYNHVHFDTKYPINRDKQTEFRTRKEHRPQDTYYAQFTGFMPFQEVSKPRLNHPILASNLTIPTRKNFNLRERLSSDLATFERLQGGGEILLLKNLQHRLIITLEDEVFDLRASKFYILLQASTDGNSEPTLGNIFFRQDQLHIDLFVFFSVFFSCFFLFLSVCVVFWKFKQITNLRRARQRQVIELTMMARRPFAKQDLILDNDDSPAFRQFEGNIHTRERRLKRWSPSVHPSAVREELLPLPQRFGVQAVTVEPTVDGLAAVTSLLIQFPGDHMKLGVGCVLTTKMFNNKPLKAYRGHSL